MTGNHVIDPLRPSDPPRLGSYRLVGRIGRGGMGTVYLAESASGERAAIKVINPDLADDDMFRDRFRREVESARRVRRFCTAPVLDAQLDGEPLFIVTEFVDGPNLDQFVRDSGPMRGSNLEHLSVGVATALTAIHGAGAAESVGRTWSVQSGRPTLADAPPARALPAESANGGAKSLTRRPWALAAAGMAAVLVLGIGAFVLFGGSGGPPSNTTLAYSDDFSNKSSQWPGFTWISDNGYYQGGYRIDAGSSIYQRRSQNAPYGGKVPERALIGADTSVLHGPPYGMLGLYCRGTGDGEDAAYYEFLVRADGQGLLIRKKAGKSVSKELLRSSSAAGFRKSKKNRLEAACEQQGKMVHLRLWVNGTFAAETTDGDGPLRNGGFGLVAMLESPGSGGDIQALFDNFLLSEIH